MDKKNLYYIVVKGTNDRLLQLTGKEPMISTKEAADRHIKDLKNISDGYNLEKISIFEYEEKFSRETGSNPEIIVPTLIARGGSIDDITIKQIGTNTHVYIISEDGSKHHIAIITGIHEDLWPQRNYPAHLINFTNQVKGGRIYFTVKIMDDLPTIEKS